MTIDNAIEEIINSGCDCTESKRCVYCATLDLFGADICRALLAERLAHDQTRRERDVLISVAASIAANIAIRINGRIVWKTNTEVPKFKVDAKTFDTAEQAIRAALAQPAPAGDSGTTDAGEGE